MDDATLLSGIVRIEVSLGRGTGFIVRIEPGTPGADVVEIVTALHVIADVEQSVDSVMPVWRGENANLRLGGLKEYPLPLTKTTVPKWSIKDDWALLRLEVARQPELVAFKLATLENRLWPRKWRSFGYSDAVPDAGEPFTGEVTFEESGFIHLGCDQAAAGDGGRVSGCSGAPSVVEGYVVGLITKALQKGSKSIHGAMYALPIGPIATACQLPLAPGPQVFESTVETLLASVKSTALIELAQALKVPLFDHEDGLRLRVARALLLADEGQVCEVLAKCAADQPEQIAVMALTRVLRDEALDAIRACLDSRNRGIVALASNGETARLLVARVLGSIDGIKRRFTHVDTRDPAAWPRCLREALATMLGNAPEDFDDDDTALAGDLSHNGVFVAFPCDPPHAALATPLTALEPFDRVRPLALLPADKQGAWQAVDDYPLVPVFPDALDEKTFLRRCKRATNLLKK